jgi:hypothetical protein
VAEAQHLRGVNSLEWMHNLNSSIQIVYFYQTSLYNG